MRRVVPQAGGELRMDPSLFMDRLRALRFPDAFNPYTDTCPDHDLSVSAARRSAALKSVLEAAAALPDGVESIWLGRDLGHLGGRRTGMALTDEAHFADYMRRWGVALDYGVPNDTDPLTRERTAGVLWSMLSRIDQPVFLWNVFPLHPHKPGDPKSNRRHTALERDAGEALLGTLIDLLRPRRLIAVGKDAAVSAKRVSDLKVEPVRHPSYGGEREFTAQIAALYDVPPV